MKLLCHLTIVPVTASLHNNISFRYGTFIVMARVFSVLLMVSLEEKSQCSTALLTAASASSIGHSWIGSSPFYHDGEKFQVELGFSGTFSGTEMSQCSLSDPLI